MGAYLKNLNGAEASMGGYARSLLQAKLSTIRMQAATVALNMAIGIGVGAAITVALSLMSKFIHQNEEAARTANELTSAYLDGAKEIKRNADTLSGLQDEFSRLSAGVDEHGKNVSLTAGEYLRYQEIVAQILELSPQLVEGYDAEGNALYNNNGLLERAIELQKELAKQKKNEYLLGGKEILKGARAELSDLSRELELGFNNIYLKLTNITPDQLVLPNINQVAEGTPGEWDFSSAENLMRHQNVLIGMLRASEALSEEEIQQIDTQIQQLKIKSKEMETVNNKVRDYLALWATEDADGGNAPWYNDIQTGYLDEFRDALASVSRDGSLSISEMQVETRRLGEAFLALQGTVPASEVDELTASYRDGKLSGEDYKSAVEGIVARLTEASDGSEAYRAATDALREAMEQAVPAARSESAEIGRGSDQLNLFIENHKRAEDAVKELESGLSLLDGALSKVQGEQSLSVDELLKLLEAYPELAAAIQFTADGYSIEAGALEALRQRRYEELILSEQAAALELFQGQLTQENSARFMTLAASLWTAADATRAHAIAQQMAQIAMAGAGYSAGELKAKIDALMTSWARVGLVRQKSITLPAVSVSGGGGGQSPEKKAAQQRIKDLQDQSKLEQEAIQDRMDALKDASDLEQKAFETEIKRWQKKKESVKKYFDEQIAGLKRTQEERDRERDRADAREEIAYWSKRTGVDAAENLADARKGLARKEEDWALEDEIREIEDIRDARMDFYDAEIEHIQEAKERAKEKYDADRKALEDEKEAARKSFEERIEAAREAEQAISGGIGGVAQYAALGIEEVAGKLGMSVSQVETACEKLGIAVTGKFTDLQIIMIEQFNERMRILEESWARHNRVIQAENSLQADINNGYIDPKTGLETGKRPPKSHDGSVVTKSGLVDLEAGEVVVRKDISTGLEGFLTHYEPERIIIDPGLIRGFQEEMAKVNQTINDMRQYYRQAFNDSHDRTVAINAPIYNIERQEIHDPADTQISRNDIDRALKKALSIAK